MKGNVRCSRRVVTLGSLAASSGDGDGLLPKWSGEPNHESTIGSSSTGSGRSYLTWGSAQAITFNSWDVASEFSTSSNPSNNGAGPFSYGYEGSLNGQFHLLTIPYTLAGEIEGWERTNNPNKGPFINHNETDVTQGPFGTKFIVYPPHAMSLHPGKACQFADVRFTAPQAGQYLISGQFYAMDYQNGTTTDEHISVNGNAIWNGQVIFGTNNSASFTPSLLSVALQTNDTIDFQVGCAGNGYLSDTTGLNAVIEQQ